ncbi:beta-glucosidase [archaeon]|nr:beta-glucosidase [archaeon]
MRGRKQKTKPGQVDRVMRSKLRHHKTLQFPRGFLWGAATSAHQVEGNNIHNDWWAWEKSSKKHPDSNSACDSYNRYHEDFNLVEKHHHNVHRLSIEWSRLEPREGQWDEEAIKHYRLVLRDLKQRKIKTMVTLHHFTLPNWFARLGGFSRKRNYEYFTDFVQKAAENFGDLVDFWITLNEPMVYTTQGYLNGVWPPHESNKLKTLRVYKSLRRAHRKSYAILHKVHKLKKWPAAKVGISNNAVSFYSYHRHSLLDYLFITVGDFLWNHMFYWNNKRFHDFIGVNYYFHHRIIHKRYRLLSFFEPARRESRDMSSVGWEINPQGLFDVLLDLQRYDKPIYVTENGIATLNESKRARFLVSYIKEIYHALQAGVDIRGYTYWSLLDNFEWEKGFEPRFGLIGVNFKNQVRVPRYTAKVYGEIAKTNSLPHKMLRLLGHEGDKDYKV